jgi:lipoyl(octanoyl) transferase
VTFHGLALNVTTDMTYFDRIHPCGFDAAVMTSMANEMECPPEIDTVKHDLVAELGAVLCRNFVPDSRVSPGSN